MGPRLRADRGSNSHVYTTPHLTLLSGLSWSWLLSVELSDRVGMGETARMRDHASLICSLEMGMRPCLGCVLREPRDIFGEMRCCCGWEELGADPCSHALGAWRKVLPRFDRRDESLVVGNFDIVRLSSFVL